MSKKYNSDERSTLQKTFLETLFREALRPLSATEIQKVSEERAIPLGRVTIYRFLKVQVRAGHLHKVQGINGGVLYEWQQDTAKHHHHFFCRECEGAFPLEGCGLKLSGFDLPKGFTVEHHEIQLIGLCDDCHAA